MTRREAAVEGGEGPLWRGQSVISSEFLNRWTEMEDGKGALWSRLMIELIEEWGMG